MKSGGPAATKPKRVPKITPLLMPELKLIVGSGPGGASGGPSANSCVCVCGE